jgi:hypothetical protein
MGKTENISSKIKNETRVSTFSILTQHSVGTSSYSNTKGKRNKRNSNKTVRSQTFANNMILIPISPEKKNQKTLRHHKLL